MLIIFGVSKFPTGAGTVFMGFLPAAMIGRTGGSLGWFISCVTDTMHGFTADIISSFSSSTLFILIHCNDYL